MKKSSSKQTKVKKNQILWQEIPENAQDKIAGEVSYRKNRKTAQLFIYDMQP